MERYAYSAEQRSLLESMEVPFAIYQFVDKRVVTLVLTEGLSRLFGYEDIQQAYYDMDHDVFQYEHPDDAARVADEAVRFATEDGTYEIIYRASAKNSSDYHIIHAIGKHFYTETGVRLAQVWYTDEGPYTEALDSHKSELSALLCDALHEESILRDSYYDHLTGLPGMTYFFELADAGKAALQKQGEDVVMLFLDFCGMKYYNTKYGFAEGDRLLRSFAKLLTDTFSHENCCRVAADHFAVYTGRKGLENTLKKLFKKAKKLNDGHSIPIHVGIYIAGTEVIPVSGAFDRAKIACDSLKNSYKSCFDFYRIELKNDTEQRQYILSSLDRALQENWIQVFYQSIVRAVTGKVSDEEALARWIDPERGFLSPAAFIPYLEDAGLIYKLDLYVLDQVLSKIKHLESNGLYAVPHSINLSRSDFDACDMVEEIRRRVDAAGVNRDKITIEITESVIGTDFDFIKKQIKRFRKLGFPVWLDDFGSGYSSLDVLQSVHFDLLKFDMSFMKKLDEGKSGKIVLREMMKLATTLGLDTVCEGVETEAQVRFLQEIGCSKLQGYYFSKPTPLEKLMPQQKMIALTNLEHPEEAGYYETIGQVNLYDLAVFTKEDDKAFQNIFNTLPMGILEIKGEDFQYVRTNQSYREFLKRFYHYDIQKAETPFTACPPSERPNFLTALKQCCESGNRMIFDEMMPDGSSVHLFVRRIDVNPVSGKTAVAVAVLSISEAGEGTSYANIARALAGDYYKIYYVDLDKEDFIEYSLPAGGREELALERHGENFFASVWHDAMQSIYTEDIDSFLDGFTKENIIRELDKNGVYSKIYRLMDTGVPTYASMKVMRMKTPGDHLIIGISLIDSEMREREIVNRIKQERSAMTRMMAMVDGYIALYTIDMETDQYIEYIASEAYQKQGYARAGQDFFRQGIEDGKRTILPEDLPHYLENFTKECVLEMIRQNGIFTLNYKLMLDGEAVPLCLVIIPFKDEEKEMLLAGVRREGR